MKANVLDKELYGRKYTGFKDYEVLKLERDLAWAKEGSHISNEELNNHIIRFYEYFMQYDKRRNFNFLETFPELIDFWDVAKNKTKVMYSPN